MDLLGPVDLKRPEVSFMVIEECKIDLGYWSRCDALLTTNAAAVFLIADDVQNAISYEDQLALDGTPRHVWFSTLISYGTARKLIEKFDVKRRAFYGNTSMEAEMSLVIANQALAKRGKLVYDPFAGTGSL